ncbi:hypothetical protein ELY33_05015 [Vreelandella andesensis]|uniref:Uncharacterized protein n=1 Tax=Vreelandella andesensis TaxID=447567 RepID=A0A433KSX4_9GAMM|nr:hypothetical protein [Halomonas andesensis]RUR32743.1 hypothetical protein ELY33_05015 [Halomonas andesensis]
MFTHRFNIPRPAIESTRRAVQSARFRESLRLRETLGYIAGDRDALTDSPPALVLTGLEVDSNGAAVASLQTLATTEGRIVRALVVGLEPGDYRFTLARNEHGEILGFDFALTDLVTRPILRRALAHNFDDPADIADVLIDAPRQPVELPERPRKPAMISESVIHRAREIERQQAQEQARRNAKPLGFTFD